MQRGNASHRSPVTTAIAAANMGAGISFTQVTPTIADTKCPPNTDHGCESGPCGTANNSKPKTPWMHDARASGHPQLRLADQGNAEDARKAPGRRQPLFRMRERSCPICPTSQGHQTRSHQNYLSIVRFKPLHLGILSDHPGLNFCSP